jgi:outer membrane protein TolC
MKTCFFVLLGLSTISLGMAQQVLSLSDAVNKALQSSFDIQIAKNNIESNSINNHISVAGGVPTVTGTANDNQQIISVNQKLNNGTIIQRDGAGSNNLNVGITASMLLYNGYRVVATKKRLEALKTLSEQQLNAQIQNTIALVMVRYYDIVRQQEYLKTLHLSIEVSKKRQDIIKNRSEVGLANDADMFQAQIDLNARQQELQAQQLVISQAKADLNNVLNNKADDQFLISDTIVVSTSVGLDAVLVSLKNNPDVLAQEQLISVNLQVEREVAAQRYPAVRLNTGYNYNRNQSAAGFTLLNQSFGPFLGLNLQVPIFNGGATKRQQQTAALTTRNTQLQKDNLIQQLQTSAVKSYQAYQNALQRLSTEQENYRLAGELLKLVNLRFDVNQATIVEVREAQKSFEDTGFRLVNLAYAAKVAEIELLRLGNTLKP